MLPGRTRGGQAQKPVALRVQDTAQVWDIKWASPRAYAVLRSGFRVSVILGPTPALDFSGLFAHNYP